MTFEEWLKGTRGAVGSEIPECMAKWAWNYQQIIIDDLTEKLEERQQKHLDSIRALRKANESIEALQAQLEVADIRPMEESAYFERIEELEEQVEWHKRRAEGWRSIAVLEENLK